MEEPDYNTRLSAFQTINMTVKEMTNIDSDFLFPIIHNSCFFIVMVTYFFGSLCDVMRFE